MDRTRTPLGSADAAWLRMDEPGNLMIITTVLFLREPVPFERFQDLITSRLDVLPRLRQRVVRKSTGAPVWETDPHFDLSCHLRVAPVGRLDEPSLQDLVARMMSVRLDPNRPPWQLHFVPEYEDGCAIIGRFHHCFGDGLALLYVLLMLTDDPPDDLMKAALAPPPRASFRSALGRLLKGLASPFVSFAHAVKILITRPSRAVVATRALLKVAFMRSAPRTMFKGPLTNDKRAIWSQPIPMGTLRAISHATGATVNDVVMAAVAGGLRQYLISRDQKVRRGHPRAIVPFNLRPIEEASELGNRFGLVFVPLPLSTDDPLERLKAVRHAMWQIKRSPERLLTFFILRMLGGMPSPFFDMVVSLFGSRSTLVITNVVGPREPLRMAGTTLKNVMFWVPASGHVGLGVSIFTYAGKLWLGIATEGTLVPDPEVIIAGFESDLAVLAEHARQARPPVPAAVSEVPTGQDPPTP